MKHLVAILLTIALVACGTDNARTATASDIPLMPPPQATDPDLDQDCVKQKASAALVKPPTVMCKTLKDGSVSSVTVQPGENQVDPVTCRIDFEGKGLIETLAEMGYKDCTPVHN